MKKVNVWPRHRLIIWHRHPTDTTATIADISILMPCSATKQNANNIKNYWLRKIGDAISFIIHISRCCCRWCVFFFSCTIFSILFAIHVLVLSQMADCAYKMNWESTLQITNENRTVCCPSDFCNIANLIWEIERKGTAAERKRMMMKWITAKDTK